MNIAEQLIKAKNNLANSRKAIVDKGGTVGEVAKFDNLASEIASIPSSDVNYLLVDDTDTVYRKQILAGASPLANIKSVGGMTYKCNNLIPFPYVYQSRELYGINFTVNDNGTVTLNGTFASNDERDFILAENLYLPAGTYTMSGISSHPNACYMFGWIKKADGSMSYPINTFTLGQGDYIYRLTIRFNSNLGTANNLVVKPMLNEGSTALPYESYYEGLRDTKVTELISNGANLLDISKCMNTVLSDNGDGTYNLTVRGTNRFSDWSPLNIPANTRIYFSGKLVSGTISVNVQFRLADGSYPTLGTINNDTWSFIYSSAITGIRLYLQSAPSDGAYSVISEPMLAYDRVSYTPYRGVIDTVAIPEKVRNDAMWGCGISGDKSNEYDFNTKKYSKYISEKILLDGVNKGFDGLDSLGRCYVRLEHATYSTTAISATRFKTVYASIEGNTFTSGHFAYFCLPSSITTKDEANVWLVENPIEFIYARREPDVIPISDGTEDNYIEVEGGGTITAVNEHENAVPSNIAYIRRTT